MELARLSTADGRGCALVDIACATASKKLAALLFAGRCAGEQHAVRARTARDQALDEDATHARMVSRLPQKCGRGTVAGVAWAANDASLCCCLLLLKACHRRDTDHSRCNSIAARLSLRST